MNFLSRLFGSRDEPPAPAAPPPPTPPPEEEIDALLDRWGELVRGHLADLGGVPLSVASMRAGGRAVPGSLQDLDDIKTLDYLLNGKVLADLRREWGEQLTSPPQRALLVEIDHAPQSRPSISFHYPQASEVEDLSAWAEQEIISRANNYDEDLAQQIAQTRITVVNLSDPGDATWRNGPALAHSRKLIASAERSVELTLEDLVAQTSPEHGEEVAEEVAEEKPARKKPQTPLTR